MENYDKSITLLREGNKNKKFGDSYLHDKSSRSHCVFRVILGGRKGSNLFVSEFNFVDLAGSELLSDRFGS